jgi:predicted short-subunit dehydrogenase-like oxidoreductase (DUF2520 family)
VNVERVAIVGAGRVGLSLARALIDSGAVVSVLTRRPIELDGARTFAMAAWGAAIDATDLVLLAVPDDALAGVVKTLADIGAIGRRHVVLHTSGLHDRSVLGALDASGAGLGSWHPLQTFTNVAGDAELLRGSPAVIEGDARALAAGRELAAALHLDPVVEIQGKHKALYHAGAVFASNYLVVIAEIAARLGRDTGAGDASRDLFLPLMRRTLASYAADGASALTGPIRRGDAGTVARHLEALTGPERSAYIALGREALRLAIASGLGATSAAAIERLLY